MSWEGFMGCTLGSDPQLFDGLVDLKLGGWLRGEWGVGEGPTWCVP